MNHLATLNLEIWIPTTQPNSVAIETSPVELISGLMALVFEYSVPIRSSSKGGRVHTQATAPQLSTNRNKYEEKGTFSY